LEERAGAAEAGRDVMDMRNPTAEVEPAPRREREPGSAAEEPAGSAGPEATPGTKQRDHGKSLSERAPAIVIALIAGAVAGLSIWYLVRPAPLLVQGEVDATRIDIAARVDGRVGDIRVARGENLAAGAVLIQIDNPETTAKLKQMLAAKLVAEAQLANVDAGTRPELVAVRKAAYEKAQANQVLAQKTYDRTYQLFQQGHSPQAQVDQMTDKLEESQRAVEQAKSAYDQAVNGYTREERQIAAANVQKAAADIESVQSIVDQMTIYAPVASQVYKRNVEPGEFVSPGAPLLSLIDLGDVWLHFDLREDLVRTVKVGDRFTVRVPALDERTITAEVKLIATKGEYASWRATRATGDFDLRTFEIRAYPVEDVPELRPGMSVYTDWRARR
jgi:HlyD family secretion protein